MIPLWQTCLATGQATVCLSGAAQKTNQTAQPCLFSVLSSSHVTWGCLSLLMPQFPHLKTVKAIIAFLSELSGKKMSFEDSENLTHCAPKSLSSKNYPYFVFLNFSDKTDLPVGCPCSRSFSQQLCHSWIFISLVKEDSFYCPVQSSGCLAPPWVPNSWCIGRGGSPSQNAFLSTVFSCSPSCVCLSLHLDRILPQLSGDFLPVCLHCSARGWKTTRNISPGSLLVWGSMAGVHGPHWTLHFISAYH